MLIHRSDLEQTRLELPMPQVQIMGYITNGGGKDPIPLARSSVKWSDYPGPDLPLPRSINEPEGKTEPLLRALGLAAHLIAGLGKRLDAYEQIESGKRRFVKGGSPNVSRISQALADAAGELRLDGHNFKGAGFSKLLTKALRELD